MAKLTLADLANLNNPTSAVTSINANNTLIETALENTLSLDGTSPNAMNANLDMNGFSIVNCPVITVQDATTVALLALPPTVGAGARAFVTDATATTFASVVVGGGSNKVPVYQDGTHWRIG